MIDKNIIEQLVREYIANGPVFLVEVKISSTGRITILADRNEGITIDECAAISRFVEGRLNRDVEDFELMVSSPGLDMPFRVIEQFYKNEGKNVEVLDKSGKKFRGILRNVNKGGFELLSRTKSGGDKKITSSVPTELSFNFDEVKSVREFVTF
jgi:ribosome maturation factor RimP